MYRDMALSSIMGWDFIMALGGWAVYSQQDIPLFPRVTSSIFLQ